MQTLVGHAADVLALLSPAPWVDLIVKASRVAVMLAVSGCAVMNPTLGLIASLIVIGVCALLFWLALRGPESWGARSLGGDVLLWRKNAAPDGGVRAFTVGKIQGMPRQTLGELSRDPNGILEFLVSTPGADAEGCAWRTLRLTVCGREGFISSVVMREKSQFRLLPRYRGVGGKKFEAALGSGLRSPARIWGLGKFPDAGGRAITCWLPDELVVFRSSGRITA